MIDGWAVALLLSRTVAPRTLNKTGLPLADRGLRLLACSQLYHELSAVFHDAPSLSTPTVLIADLVHSKMAKLAEVVFPGPRGRAEQVALHGGTLVRVEALVLALATSAREAAMTTVERLDVLRAAVAGKRSDVHNDLG